MRTQNVKPDVFYHREERPRAPERTDCWEKAAMTDVSIVFVTVGKEEEASALGRALVEEGLIACANIVAGIRSIYRWKGEICDEPELLLIMKTRTLLVPALKARVRELHSYEVPEIISWPIEQGLPEYLDWVVQNTRE